MTRVTRRTLLAGATTTAIFAPYIHRGYAAEGLKVGSLSDLNSVYATLSGPGAVMAVKLAAEDFSKEHPDLPVEVVVSDFQLKSDVGLSIARNWFDTQGVDCIVDIPLSAMALGMTTLAKERNKVLMMTSTATDDLTGKYCGPNHVHWTHDTYGLGVGVARAWLNQGKDTWFFILADYAMGKSQVASMTQVIEKSGGKVVGSAAHPFPGTTDFSGFLLQAKASGAKIICLANSGSDAVNCVKQAVEFGMVGPKASGDQVMTMTLFDTPLVYAIGLDVGQGLTYSAPAYWDRNDALRTLAKRLAPALNNNPMAANHVGDYTGTYWYLKAAAAVGLPTAKKDGRAVVEQLKSMKIDDPYLGKCVVRPDGRNVHDMLLMKIKKPSESKAPFDLASIEAVIPGDQAFRPMAGGGCPMVSG
ncbi:MAG: ABC transporter substrate-binding protein [Proteobacteria bacterium]|nr:ABC transporter substrate-binding protein [Pseudomonadota bacterium]